MKFSAPGDGPPLAFGEDEKDVVSHRVVDPIEEVAGQVGTPPFPAARILVKGPESIPVICANVVAGEAPDRAAEGPRGGAFPADRLTFAR